GRLRRSRRLVRTQGAADGDGVGGDRGRFGNLFDRRLDRLGRRLRGSGGFGGGFGRGLLTAGRKQQGKGDGGQGRQAGGSHCGALEASGGVAIIWPPPVTGGDGQQWCSCAKYSADRISTRREAVRSKAPASRSPVYSPVGGASALHTR